jgi:hypothetical protein
MTFDHDPLRPNRPRHQAPHGMEFVFMFLALSLGWLINRLLYPVVDGVVVAVISWF